MARSDERVALALREYESTRAEEAALLSARREKVYNCLPRVREIDRELSRTAPDAIAYYLQSGERDKDKLLAYLKNKNQMLRAERKRLMEIGGFPDDYLELHYQCPICQDTGFVDGKRCRCLTQKLIRMAYESSNLQESLKTQNFDTFDLQRFPDMPFKGNRLTPRRNMELIVAWLKDYAAHFPENDPLSIYFYGTPGTGKTFLSSCLAKAVLDRGFNVLYLTADDLCTKLEKERFVSRKPENASLDTDLVRSVDLLMIDDLGTEFMTQLSSSLLLSVINSRIIDRKATVISSNLSIPDLTKRYSERFTSRIQGSYQIMELYGPDQRLIR